MAEFMEKPPPYAPPDPSHDADNKFTNAPPQFGTPAYQHGPPGPGPYSGGSQQVPPPGATPYPGTQYPPAPPPGQPFPNYGSTVYVHQPPPATQIILVGGCPACRIGVLEDDFSFLGICLAILCFPIGILCCLAMRHRRCPNCGAIFG